jgi:Rieske Fe-S protein
MTMPHRCEHCVSRRDFLATTLGATTLASLAACGDGILAGVPAPPPLPAGPVVITVGDFPQLANPGFLVRVPQTFVAVKRVDATTFAGLSMICTHQGCATSIVGGQRLDCPCHLSRFDVNGDVLNGPNTGESIGPLAPVATSYNATTDQLTIG